MSILHDIYSEKYSPERAVRKIPFSLRLQERAFFDAVETAMGPDFLQRHRAALEEAARFRDYAGFREGFRLGVSLMRELL